MVIRFEREDAPGENAGSHYSGFIVPSCALLSELMALLPERCDLLRVRGAVWRIRQNDANGRPLFYMAVDREGSYAFGLLANDEPVTTISRGRIWGELSARGDFLIRSAACDALIARLKT